MCWSVDLHPVSGPLVGRVSDEAVAEYVIPSGDGLAPIDSFACSVGLVDWVAVCWLALGLIVRDGV